VKTVACLVASLVALALSAGCSSSTAHTTRLSASDYRFTIEETKKQLLESDMFRDRNSASPKMTVTVDKVINLTSDIIPEGEQWGFVWSVWSDPSVQSMARSKNIATQVRPDIVERLQVRIAGTSDGIQLPTHLMSATFDSATRTSKERKSGWIDSRLDRYQMIYHITDVRTGEVVWNSIVEFAKEADGLSIN
jgi:hypothetical protein